MTGGLLAPGHAPLADHPLANLFPLLSQSELTELADDIKTRGQVETIKLHRGMILDGRNRYRACALHSLGVRYELFTGGDRDALDWVISKNLRRRHLTESQRAMVAAKLATLKLGDNQHVGAQICAPSLPLRADDQSEPPPPALVSQGEAAELLAVSRRSVQNAKKVQEQGAPELQQAVETGKVAVSAAADIAALPVEEQKKILAAADPKAVTEVTKKINKEKNEKRRAERVEKIKAIAAGNSELPTARKFPVLYIDPPTKFAAGDSDRSTENHYPTMTEEELTKLPIGELAMEHAVLFVWSTVPWLRKTMRLIEGWGFDYKSEFVWDKRIIGLGFWNRNRHENLLIATRGKFPAPAPEVLEPSLYREEKGAHSAKPDYFRGLISTYYPDLPKVELFPRIDGALPPGWFAWGNEARVPAQQALTMEEGER